MKKILTILILLIFFAFSIYLIQKKQSENKKTIVYQLNGRTYQLLTATTSQEWEKGLMFYRKLDGADGMIFIFPDKKVRSFWNKNTFIDLKLYWLDDDNVIGESYLPSIEKSKDVVVVSSHGKANKVIELAL